MPRDRYLDSKQFVNPIQSIATQCGKQLKGLLQRTSSHSLAYVFKELSFTGLYLLKGSENQIRIDKKKFAKIKNVREKLCRMFKSSSW